MFELGSKQVVVQGRDVFEARPLIVESAHVGGFPAISPIPQKGAYVGTESAYPWQSGIVRGPGGFIGRLSLDKKTLG